MVGMPNILIFQIILPLFSPLADLMMIIGLFGDKPGKILTYYVAFVLIDFVVAIIAFWMEKEDYRKLIYIIPQRFIWRQLMYYVLFKSIRKALKGELSGWGVLKRTGNVNEGKDESVVRAVISETQDNASLRFLYQANGISYNAFLRGQ